MTISKCCWWEESVSEQTNQGRWTLRGKRSRNVFCSRTKWTKNQVKKKLQPWLTRFSLWGSVSGICTQRMGMMALLLGFWGPWCDGCSSSESWLCCSLTVNFSFLLCQMGRMALMYFTGPLWGLKEMMIHFHRHLLRTYYGPSLPLNPEGCVSCKELSKFKILSIILYF